MPLRPTNVLISKREYALVRQHLGPRGFSPWIRQKIREELSLWGEYDE